MKAKLFILLLLGAMAGGTTVWAAKGSMTTASGLPAAAKKTSGCCGLCDPDEPCPFCTQ